LIEGHQCRDVVTPKLYMTRHILRNANDCVESNVDKETNKMKTSHEMGMREICSLLRTTEDFVITLVDYLWFSSISVFTIYSPLDETPLWKLSRNENGNIGLRTKEMKLVGIWHYGELYVFDISNLKKLAFNFMILYLNLCDF